MRLAAARLFEQGVAPVQVARRLRVSTKSAYQWRRRWRTGGDTALASKGPGGATCRLSSAQMDRLRAELARGPAAHGWADPRWTLARIALLIGRLFHVRYTLRGTSYLLHRIGFTVQVPARRAAERDGAKIATWRNETWGRYEALGRVVAGAGGELACGAVEEVVLAPGGRPFAFGVTGVLG